MRILIDIGHPGHVHLLKNFYFSMQKNGHKLFVTVKNVKSAWQLLNKFGIKYLNLGNKNDSIIGKAIDQIKYDWKIINLVKKEKIDIGIGTSINLAHVSKLSQMKSIILDDDDDEVEPLFVKFAHPFSETLLSPDVLKGKRKKKDTIFYSGYHELAYLHPNWFKPDKSVLSEANLKEDESFFVMRFNVFKAHHDVGAKGLSLEQKLKLIEILKPHGKIFITTERDIDPELQKYQYRLSPERMHHFLYYSTMFLGDSQTMTSEAAVLGTPAIKCNSFAGKLSVPNELEKKYELNFSFLPNEFDIMIRKIKELLSNRDLKKIWKRRRQKLLAEKIDVTSFLIWFVENYPKSAIEMKNNPEIQNQFK